MCVAKKNCQHYFILYEVIKSVFDALYKANNQGESIKSLLVEIKLIII